MRLLVHWSAEVYSDLDEMRKVMDHTDDLTFDEVVDRLLRDLRAKGRPLVEATIEACSLRFRPIVMTGLAFVSGVLPMVIAKGAGGASQQALGTSVMGGMIAVVILALLMVPVFFVSVQRVLAGDRTKAVKKEVDDRAARVHGAAE